MFELFKVDFFDKIVRRPGGPGPRTLGSGGCRGGVWRRPGGAFWAALGFIVLLLGPSGCLFPGQGAAGGQKEASGVDFGSHLGSNGVVFNDLLGSPRGVFFITFSKLFLQHNCSENNCQRLLRARSAEHGNAVKHNSVSRFFEVSRTAGHTASKPTEEENCGKNNHQQATKISSKLNFSAFQIRAPNIPPKWCPGASPGASRDGPKAAQDGPKRPEYKSYPREGTSYPRERTSYPWENAPGGPGRPRGLRKPIWDPPGGEI